MAELKPVFVSNQDGSAALLPNHLASMAFYLYEAHEASAGLAAVLAPPSPVVAETAEAVQAADGAAEEVAVP